MWLYIKTDKDSVFTRSHAEFWLSFSIDQSFKRLSKLVRITGMLENLNLAVNLKKKIFKKYNAVAIFFLYGNKNVPSAKILRGRRCLRTRTFILFGLAYNYGFTFYRVDFLVIFASIHRNKLGNATRMD